MKIVHTAAGYKISTEESEGSLDRDYYGPKALNIVLAVQHFYGAAHPPGTNVPGCPLCYARERE